MKKYIISQIVNFKVLLILLFSITVVSCSNSQKGEDTKEIAEEHNDAKFEDNDKEKDAQFLVNAAEINLEEISLGQLAQKNGNTADLKELGKMMEAGHTKSLTELTLLAQQKLITIPTSSTNDAQESHKKMDKKSLENFDKEYCDKMVKSHKDAISLFEKASTESTDSDIKAWATLTLQELRTHLDHALTCQQKLEKM